MVDNHLVYSTCLAGSVGERIGEHVIAGGTGAPAIAIQTDRLICKEGYNQFTNKFTYLLYVSFFSLCSDYWN